MSVSCRAIARFTAKARASGINPATLLEGFPHPPTYLQDRRNFVPWEEFCDFAERLRDLAGGAPALQEICMAETGRRREHAMGTLLSWVISPQTLSRFVLKAFSRVYPCLAFESTESGDSRLTLRITIPAELRDCEAVLQLAVGCLRTMPRWIAHPEAEVEARFEERVGEYRIKLPPSRSFFARVQRSWSIFFSGRIAVDILRQQAEELKASYEQLEETRQRLEREVATASHREQKRIALRLERKLGNVLSRIADNAGALEAKLRDVSPSAHADAAGIHELLLESVVMTRDLAHGLDPIGRGGTLEDALRSVASNTRNLCGVSCEFNQIGRRWTLDHTASLNLYRLSQEAINNAIRHGCARHIRILMASADDVCSLTITDDGVGIQNVPKKHTGRGTKIMQYRATMVDGTLRIESVPGESTSVSCIVKTPQARRQEKAIPLPSSQATLKLRAAR